MKRYLTAYSRETLTIRDRKTGLSKRVAHCTKENAEVIQNAVMSTNYYLNQSKNGKVQKKSIEEVQSWLSTVSKKHRTEWGWIQPSKIQWVKEEPEINKETELVQRLNNILKGV